MMSPHFPAIDFRANARRVAPATTAAVQRATMRFLGNRAAVVQEMGQARWEDLRRAAHDLRLHTLEHLDYYLIRAEAQILAAGGSVHWARDAEEARRIVLRIAQQHGARCVVKAKSMVTEEVGLSQALEAAGIEVLETDLGEYLVQLAGQGPSHIIVPAVHLTKEDIAALFRRRLGVDAPAEPQALAGIARSRLREAFLSAGVGITGANFLVAETGTLVIVTNEGNGRMCTTLPPVHVAVVGIEKVVPDWESLTVLLKVLARSATGQKLSCYTSFITGPRRDPAEHGPRQLHVVVLDNGRTRILRDAPARETLLCVRCGACLNVCPVYNHVGGHAYGGVYSGPIGAILTPQLLGTAVAGSLPFASTLCGACSEICPVKIPIPEILLHLRRRAMEGDDMNRPVASGLMRAGAKVSAWFLRDPRLYAAAARLAGVMQRPLRRDGWLHWLPPPLGRWTLVRPFPTFQGDFRSWWRRRRGGRMAARPHRIGPGSDD